MKLDFLNKPNKQLITSCFFLLGLVIIIYGLNMYNTKDIHSKITEATIVSSSCIPGTPVPTKRGGERIRSSGICNISVTYTVDDKTYKTQIYKDDDYDLGDTITLYYDPENPIDIVDSIQDYTNKSLVFIILGLIMFSCTTLYVTFYSKTKN